MQIGVIWILKPKIHVLQLCHTILISIFNATGQGRGRIGKQKGRQKYVVLLALLNLALFTNLGMYVMSQCQIKNTIKKIFYYV